MTLNDHYGFLRDTNASTLQQKNWESDDNVNRWSIAMNKLINCLLRRGVLLLVLASTLFSGSMAFAQNAANGKILYCAPVVTGVVKCADRACHGSSVATNNNKIKNGANNLAASTGKGISFAIGSVSEMRALSPLSTTQLNDLGAFIAAPSVCTTAAAPGASIAPAALTFASTTVGSTAAMRVATLTNSGTAALSITSTDEYGRAFWYWRRGRCRHRHRNTVNLHTRVPVHERWRDIHRAISDAKQHRNGRTGVGRDNGYR